MVNIELSLHEICSNYGKHQVLHRLSASPLTGGNVVGLLGPNASGKSTLIKAIAQVPVSYTHLTLPTILLV